MAATSSPDIESYIKRILPDQPNLPQAGRKTLATLIAIDANEAGTTSSLFLPLEQIGKNHALTAFDVEMFGEIANSIAAVAVKSEQLASAEASAQQGVRFAVNAIRDVRKASCRSSASPASLSSIIGKFRDMLAVEQTPYTGNSVGYEVELLSDGPDEDGDSEQREVHLGPFTCRESAEKSLHIARELTCLDEDGNLSTVHASLGLTKTQLTNYQNPKYRADYDTMFSIISYMANSAARNVAVRNKIFHYNEILPECNAAYQNKTDAVRDLAFLENEKNKEKSESGAIKPEFETQIARLEWKSLCVAPDADDELVSHGIESAWYTLDDPKLAKPLANGLKSILTAAAIDMSNVPVVRPPRQGNIRYDALTAEELRRVDDWSVDFGYIDKNDNQLKGRQVEYREVINYYLKEFNNCNEAAALPQAVQRAREINLAAAEWKAAEDRLRATLKESHPEMTGPDLEKHINEAVPKRLEAEKQIKTAGMSSATRPPCATAI